MKIEKDEREEDEEEEIGKSNVEIQIKSHTHNLISKNHWEKLMLCACQHQCERFEFLSFSSTAKAIMP